MTLITRDDLETLVLPGEGPRVSIYLPMERMARETRENPIRFKNAVTEAEELLADWGLRPNQTAELLHPFYELASDHVFWQQQSYGLVALLSSDEMRLYRLPLEFEPLTIVDQRYQVKPLLEPLSANGRFVLLTLNRDEINLLEGTRFLIDDVDLEDVPESLSEALKWDDPESRLQWHSSTPVTPTQPRRKAMFHGHGVGEEDFERNRALRYLRMVDEGVTDLIAGTELPLVVAGVEEIVALYREASHYPHLVEGAIVHNPQDLSDGELQQRAWAIVEPKFIADLEASLDRYHMHMGREDGLATDDLAEILLAAHDQRVARLFVDKRARVWGLFDPDARHVAVHAEKSAESIDLLDEAAVQTLINGGAIYALEPEEMPAEHLAAVLRF